MPASCSRGSSRRLLAAAALLAVSLIAFAASVGLRRTDFASTPAACPDCSLALDAATLAPEAAWRPVHITAPAGRRRPPRRRM